MSEETCVCLGYQSNGIVIRISESLINQKSRTKSNDLHKSLWIFCQMQQNTIKFEWHTEFEQKYNYRVKLSICDCTIITSSIFFSNKNMFYVEKFDKLWYQYWIKFATIMMDTFN